eukprot:11311167-Prorocentrum_lima.AAC.1
MNQTGFSGRRSRPATWLMTSRRKLKLAISDKEDQNQNFVQPDGLAAQLRGVFRADIVLVTIVHQ